MIRGHSDIGNSLQALGRRIERARRASGLTLEQAAARAGVHHSQLSRIERGQFRLIGNNVRKICRVLGVDLDGVDHDFLCERVRATIRSPQAARAMNAFLDVINSAESR